MCPQQSCFRINGSAVLPARRLDVDPAVLHLKHAAEKKRLVLSPDSQSRLFSLARKYILGQNAIAQIRLCSVIFDVVA